jgi:hypothetical protein
VLLGNDLVRLMGQEHLVSWMRQYSHAPAARAQTCWRSAVAMRVRLTRAAGFACELRL